MTGLSTSTDGTAACKCDPARAWSLCGTVPIGVEHDSRFGSVLCWLIGIRSRHMEHQCRRVLVRGPRDSCVHRQSAMTFNLPGIAVL